MTENATHGMAQPAEAARSGPRLLTAAELALVREEAVHARRELRALLAVPGCLRLRPRRAAVSPVTAEQG